MVFEMFVLEKEKEIRKYLIDELDCTDADNDWDEFKVYAFDCYVAYYSDAYDWINNDARIYDNIINEVLKFENEEYGIQERTEIDAIKIVNRYAYILGYPMMDDLIAKRKQWLEGDQEIEWSEFAKNV